MRPRPHLEQLQPDRLDRRRRMLGSGQTDPTHVGHQHISRRREQDPELARHELVATRAVGEEHQLLFLVPVFHVTALTVGVLVQVLRIAGEIGHEEAGLPSFGLEEPFVWAARRTLKQSADRWLYERARTGGKNSEEACRSYLTEKWSTRSMHKFVDEYQRHLAKREGPLEFTVKLQRLEFGSDGWDSVKNRVTVYADDDLVIDKNGVPSMKGQSTMDVDSFTFTGKRSDTIALQVEIECTSGNFVFSNKFRGTGTAKWTIDEVHQAQREIDLVRFGNRAVFRAEGLPKAPVLPEYPK